MCLVVFFSDNVAVHSREIAKDASQPSRQKGQIIRSGIKRQKSRATVPLNHELYLVATAYIISSLVLSHSPSSLERTSNVCKERNKFQNFNPFWDHVILTLFKVMNFPSIHSKL
jgi:hypothetical protein